MKEVEYNVDDMIRMFGDRIKSAVVEWEHGNKAIDAKKMRKLIKKWKFWNKDIREAYRHYYGYLLAPYIIVDNPIGIINSTDSITKNIVRSRYSECKINPDNYTTIKMAQ